MPSFAFSACLGWEFVLVVIMLVNGEGPTINSKMCLIGGGCFFWKGLLMEKFLCGFKSFGWSFYPILVIRSWITLARLAVLLRILSVLLAFCLIEGSCGLMCRGFLSWLWWKRLNFETVFVGEVGVKPALIFLLWVIGVEVEFHWQSLRGCHKWIIEGLKSLDLILKTLGLILISWPREVYLEPQPTLSINIKKLPHFLKPQNTKFRAPNCFLLSMLIMIQKTKFTTNSPTQFQN